VIEPLQQLSDRFIEFREREEAAVAQCCQNPAFDN